MSPDSPEVRLARLEEQLRSTEKQVDVFGPVARQVLEAVLKLEELAGDLNDLKQWRNEFRELIAEVRRHLENQISACSHAISEVKRDIEQEQKELAKERKRREDALDRERVAKQDFRQKVVLSIVGGSFIVAAALVTALLAGG